MKIAIITHYYKSQNYGGCLQAYALCKILNNASYNAEQLSFEKIIDKNNSLSNKLLYLKKPLRCIKFTALSFLNLMIRKKIQIRKKSFYDFSDSMIPHSNVYNKNNISGCVDTYDVYITGSDQVWNPQALCPEYLLDFVPSDKLKISYAASISQFELTQQQSDTFKKSLSDYTAVSVREHNAVDLLKNISPVEVEWTLDPTLLLSDSQWNEICPKRIVNEDYIFCYFLGNDVEHRKTAKKFAKIHNLKIVTLPYMQGNFRKCDMSFGDYKLYNISPAEFLSLVKYAEYVFTDSFHAMVFSNIYKRQYFIFERIEYKSMKSRINSLSELLKKTDRFCDTPQKSTFEYINGLPDIDYTEPQPELEQMKKKSLEFLWKNLNKKRD